MRLGDKGFKKKILSGSLWTGFSSAFQNIFQFVLLITLARLLTPSDFGIVSIYLIIVSFIAILAQLGISQVIIQKKDLSSEELQVSFTVLTLFTLGTMVVFWLNSKIILNFFSVDSKYILTILIELTIFVQYLAVVPDALLQRKLNYRVLSIIELFSYTLGYGVLGIILAYQDFGFLALMYSNICYHILRFIMLVIIQPFSLKMSFNKKFFKEIIQLGFGFCCTKVISYIAIQGDNWIVGKFLGKSSLGIYSRIYQLVALPAKIFGMFTDKLLFSILSRIQDDGLKIKKIYFSALNMSAMILVPFSIYVYIFAKEIILFLLGNQWASAVIPLKLFCVSIFFRASYKIGETISNATGHVYSRVFRQTIYALSVVILSMYGARYGINGVVIGMNIAIFINFLLITQLTHKILNIKVTRSYLSTVKVFGIGFLYFLLLKFSYNYYFSGLKSPMVALMLSGTFTVIYIAIFILVTYGKQYKTFLR